MMRHRLMLVLAAAAGLSARVLTAGAVSPSAPSIADSAAPCALSVVMATTPPDKPEGDDKPGGDTPPDKPGGDTHPDKPSGGGTSGSVALTGVLQLNGESASYDGGEEGAALASTNADENVVLVRNGASLTLSNYTLTKTGDCSSEDNSNFFAVNAVVAAQTNSAVYIDNSAVKSFAEGANCLFATGPGSTIYAYACALTSTNDSSRGLDATYAGTVIGSKLSIATSGDHCATLATDRGKGSISVTQSTLSTAGQGSALIYSTGVVEANGVTGTATGAQIAGIEGLSTIRIKNSTLSGSGKKASEPVVNGVIIYQSMSGDSTEGTATFEVSSSTLKSAIGGGAMFYITNTKADITVQNTELDFDTDGNCLIMAAGNDGEHGWGTVGSNGGEVVFTAIDQTLAGNISVDGISSLNLYLTNSTYAGAFIQDTTYTGDGGATVFLGAGSTWTATASCVLKGLTVAPGATIVDAHGKTVPVYDASGTKVADGDSDVAVTVSAYSTDPVVIPHAITAFEIDRSAFEERYETSGHHTGATYYVKPHAPANAVLKVRVKGEENTLTPDMDHKYWLDDYWDDEKGVTLDLIYSTENGYLFIDGRSVITQELTVTTNKMEIDPPACTETVRAEASISTTYYRTLKQALDAAGKRARVTLLGDVTLEDAVAVTNSITLDLSTNTVTLGSALTRPFHFTAGATVSNGTIRSTLAANAEGSVLLRFTDCKATLKDLTIDGRGYEVVVAHDSTAPVTNKYASGQVSDTLTCEGLVVTGSGCLLSVDHAKATLAETCSLTADGALATFGGAREAAISCTGNGTVEIAGGTYAAPKVLQSGDCGGAITVNGGTFSGQIYSWMTVGVHPELESLAAYKARFALNAGTYADAAVAFASADARDLDSFTKGDGVEIALPSGYAWQDNTLVTGPVAPGVTSAPYHNAVAATNAAAAINADRAASIAVPTGVEAASTAAYLEKVEATVTRDNRVVIDLTPAAAVAEQAVVDAAVTSEAVAATLASSDASAKATVAATTPGLYYWLEGGTDLGAVMEAGAAALSTNGGAVELSKPSLDAAKGRAFFRVAAGVSPPARSGGD